MNNYYVENKYHKSKYSKLILDVIVCNGSNYNIVHFIETGSISKLADYLNTDWWNSDGDRLFSLPATNTRSSSYC